MKKYGSASEAFGCFSAFSGGRRGNEFPGHEQQIFQGIAPNPGKPYQNGWVIYIVICYVIRVRVSGDHFVSVINTDPDDETIRLSRLVNRDARQKFPAKFQARRSIGGAVLNVG